MDKETNPFAYSLMMTGLYMGIAMCISDLFFFLSGNAFSDWSNIVTLGILVVGINMGIRYFRDEVIGGIISFSRGWFFGIGMSFYAAFVYAFFVYIYIHFIDMSLMDIFIATEKEALLASGYTNEEIETLIISRGNEKLFTPYGVAIVQIFLINFYGVAIALVASLFNHCCNRLKRVFRYLKISERK